MDSLGNHFLESAKESLAVKIFDQGVHYRILFVGRSHKDRTDIASNLCRSLRNLGHHVLNLDLEKHRDLCRRPKIVGGFAPDIIEPIEFDKFCSSFDPQIIVLCANRLTFGSEHAKQLKQKGIVLIGMRWCDRDVDASVHPHADVFDFFTTNTRQSADAHQRSGFHNTLYFPPAVDRGVICQGVSPIPNGSVEVSFISHTSRERRLLSDALFKSNYKEIPTPTQGFPSSDGRADGPLYQAIHADMGNARIRIKRAGYGNIACEGFELVGSGALLCTNLSDPLAEFFRYDTEIVCYENEKDVINQLSLVLRSPKRVRRMIEAAFERLASEHLYEHRWMSLLETVFNCSPVHTPWLEDTRIQAIRNSLARSLPRCKPVVVSGFYGARNVGDEIILSAIQYGFRTHDTAVQLTVAAENPVAVERDHGLQAFHRRNLSQAEQYSRSAAAILIGGGGLWHDYTFAKSGGLLGLFQEPQLSMASFAPLQVMARFFNTPCHVVGMGVGPITDPDAFRMLRFVAELADTIYVRDEQSLALLSTAGATKVKAQVAPDLAYSLPLPEIPIATEMQQSVRQLKAEGYTIVGINLRPWAVGDESALFSRIAQGLRLAAQDRKLVVITIPMQGVDNAALRRFRRAWGSEVKHIVLKAPLSLDDVIGAMMVCDVVLAMRLHACLVGHRLRKPVVGIAYDPKVASHFEQLGRSQFFVTLGATSAKIAEVVSAALREQGQLPIDTRRQLSTIEAEARCAVEVAVQRISDLPSTKNMFDRVRKWDQVKPVARWRRILSRILPGWQGSS